MLFLYVLGTPTENWIRWLNCVHNESLNILIQTKSFVSVEKCWRILLGKIHNFPSLEIQISFNNIWGKIFWIFWVAKKPFTQRKGKANSLTVRSTLARSSRFFRYSGETEAQKKLKSFTCFKNKIAESRELLNVWVNRGRTRSCDESQIYLDMCYVRLWSFRSLESLKTARKRNLNFKFSYLSFTLRFAFSSNFKGFFFGFFSKFFSQSLSIHDRSILIMFFLCYSRNKIR